jgi:diaminopimelate decarboxylase/aspartate kinase
VTEAPIRPWVVLKFGGTSVSSRECWETIGRIAAGHQEAGRRPLIVCSALSGVSNALEALPTQAVEGDVDAPVDWFVARHRELGEELGLGDIAAVGEYAEELRKVALGISLTGEVSARIRARMLAVGELASTRMGAAFLNASGMDAHWLDVREHLQSSASDASLPKAKQFLSAHVEHGEDAAMKAALAAIDADVVLTQGFIASNAAGETVLLGRGGSDTSATCLAARIGAVRCEIWTDVPGMYSANPHQIPEARLLRSLDYDEAQELASTGAKVLHPRCLAPVREARIPLHVRCTSRPDRTGTVISSESSGDEAQVKAISARGGITLVSMDTVGMWQQVGFLADVFACFKARGLSVDLVSTSETNVTVSLDSASNVADGMALDGVVEDLSAHCNAHVIGPCASVSLVGRKIRAILHKLGPALSVFEEHRVHLVGQAANDLNLTFVVDEDQAERLVARLHDLLFSAPADAMHQGPTWREDFAPPQDVWWRRRREELLTLSDETSPAFVYDEPTLDAAVEELKGLDAVDRVLYSIKANSHPEILTRFVAAGLGLECVSPGEVQKALDAGCSTERVLFTPNFAPRRDYEAGISQGVTVTLDSLHPLENWAELFADVPVFLRLDPGQGRGHHEFVMTAGSRSKFGIAPNDVERAAELVTACGARVVGLHAHAGSGVLGSEGWSHTAGFLRDAAGLFGEVRTLNLGGGLGVVEKPGQTPLDLHELNASLHEFKDGGDDFELWIEPGRFLVARAGVLLARVTQVKRKAEGTWIGVETGMNSLIRPALYGAYHEIVNLSRLDAPRNEIAHVVGPICESGDTLGYARSLPRTSEGDVLLIATAGAYGRAMSSHYNSREPASERFLRG